MCSWRTVCELDQEYLCCAPISLSRAEWLYPPRACRRMVRYVVTGGSEVFETETIIPWRRITFPRIPNQELHGACIGSEDERVPARRP
jgi:hypothetical protein